MPTFGFLILPIFLYPIRFSASQLIAFLSSSVTFPSVFIYTFISNLLLCPFSPKVSLPINVFSIIIALVFKFTHFSCFLSLLFSPDTIVTAARFFSSYFTHLLSLYPHTISILIGQSFSLVLLHFHQS